MSIAINHPATHLAFAESALHRKLVSELGGLPMSVIISGSPHNPGLYHVWAVGADGFYRWSEALPCLTAAMFEQYPDRFPAIDSAIERFRSDVEERNLIRRMDIDDLRCGLIIERCGLMMQ